MPDRVLYDTRFFVEYFYSENKELLRKLKEELRSVKERMVSTLTVHEMHRINLKKEGKDVANLRSDTIHRDFRVVDVDYETAIKSAELRSGHQIPMADSVIAAAAQIYRCSIFSDDAHFKEIQNLKTKWCTIP
ncbi:MAG: PIN domain-containing protein [Candidatus Bathyarchaeia archaeon]